MPRFWYYQTYIKRNKIEREREREQKSEKNKCYIEVNPIPGKNFATQILDDRRDMSMKFMLHEPLE